MRRSGKTRLFQITLFLIFLAFFSAANANATDHPRLAVLGVTHATEEKELDNLLIAQGIAQLAAQELYDTGLFAPVENNPEITARINELVSLYLHTGSEEIDQEKLLTSGRALGCQAVATVHIARLSKSRSRVGLGPFSSAKTKVKIEVEVSLKHGDDPLIAARGTGSGVTKSKAFLFLVRKDKVSFDKTSVGRATQEAVREAVGNLVALMREKK